MEPSTSSTRPTINTMIPSVHSNGMDNRKPRRSNTNPMTIMARMYPSDLEPKRRGSAAALENAPCDGHSCD